MIPVNDSKTFCLYCRGEIKQPEYEKGKIIQTQQYHQECYNEIIKDNHCEYCSNILDELNSFFTDLKVRVHQKCIVELEQSLTEQITTLVSEFFKEQPLKKLAKSYAFYEMGEEKYDMYEEELLELLIPQLPDFSEKTVPFQLLMRNITKERMKIFIVEFTKNALQLKLNTELEKCRPDSKKDTVNKTVSFIWKYYLEVPIFYKDRLNHKVLPKPDLDNVNCIIFHFILEKLFNTSLDFNSTVNNNFNQLTDYLMGQPISIQKLQF